MTRKQDLVSKGKSYTIVSGINAKGEAVKAFLASEDAKEIANVAVPSPAVLEKALSAFPLVDIDFNERGRAEAVRPVDDK